MKIGVKSSYPDGVEILKTYEILEITFFNAPSSLKLKFLMVKKTIPISSSLPFAGVEYFDEVSRLKKK